MALRAIVVLLLAGLGPQRPTPPGPDRSRRALVAVDAGHTRAAPGAVSARGVPERTFNLAVAQRLVSALRREGLRAVLLDGEELAPAERAARAAGIGAAALVSIHHDSVQPRYLSSWVPPPPSVANLRVRYAYSDRFSGFSVFYSAQNGAPAASLALARAVAGALRGLGLSPTLHHAELIPGEGRTLVDPGLGLYRFDGLAILRRAAMPAVLVECGVIVNRDEELLLASEERRGAIAGAIARATRAVLAGSQGSAPAETAGGGSRR